VTAIPARSLLCLPFLLLASLVSPIAAQGNGGLAPAEAERLERLRDKAAVVSFKVEPLSLADGSRWIALDALVEGVFDASLEQVVATLTDWDAAPEIYSRVVEIQVLSLGPDAVRTRQTSGVSLFGLHFYTTIDFSNTLVREGPGKALLAFRMTGSDGGTRKAEGEWACRELVLPGGLAVHTIYRISLIVEARFPAQLSILRSFGKADLERTMRELGEAIRR
jgi:hypothetical protein